MTQVNRFSAKHLAQQDTDTDMSYDEAESSVDDLEVVEELTPELFTAALPKQFKSHVNPEMLASINNIINSDNYMRASYRDNLLGFTTVLRDNKFKLQEYMNAVKFVSYRLMGLGVNDSYIRTFPDRYQRMLSEGADAKYMSSFSSAYNKTKIVTLITEQALVPTHILNADLFQEAINTQASLMRDTSVSPKVRSDAANSLLTHLKQPEKTKVELDIKVNEGKTVDELREVTRQLAEQQMKMIQSGSASIIDVAHSRIVQTVDIDSEDY